MTVAGVAGLFVGLPGVDLLDAADRYAVDGCVPAVAVRPRTRADVSTVLAHAAANGLAVVPWGGGTAMSLGGVPARYDVALDLSALDCLIEHRPRDLTVTVEAGMTIAAVQRALDAHRQLVALDPWLPERATVGGTLAANRTGPRRFRYGTARDILIGATAVLADGTEIAWGGRVVKNVAGYDMGKLLIGSHGTLAVITSATFKLLPAPPARGMVAAIFPTLEQAHGAAMRVAGSTLAPLTLELAAPSTARTLAPALPQGWLLAVEVAGAEAGVERSRREVLAVARDAGCLAALDLDPEERERLSAGIRDFGCAEEPSGLAVGSDTALLARAAVLPSRVAEVCRLLLAEGEPQVLARAGTGVVYAAWPESAAGELHHRISRLRGALQAHGGVLVLERCPPSLKQLGVDVWGITGADVALMRRIKREFDPAGILSPGRGPGEN